MLPRDGSQIVLINNPNFIKFQSPTLIDRYLPYAGIVRIGGGLNQLAAIQHKGEITSFKITHDDTKRISFISFIANGKNEQYDITLKVYPNAGASMFVNSTKSDGIRYKGEISILEEANL